LAKSKRRDQNMTHLLIEGRALAAALKPIVATVEKSTIPILQSVLMRAEAGELVLTGTDLDIWTTTTASVSEIGDDFAACLNLRQINSIARMSGSSMLSVKSMPDEKASIDIGDGDMHFELTGYAVDDFPTPKEYTFANETTFTNNQFASIVSRLLPFISTEETRYYLNGIHITSTLMEATDGHRLVRIEHKAEISTDVIVPRKVAMLAARLDVGERMKIAFADLAVKLVFGSTSMICKCIDGTYPNTDKVVPKRDGVTYSVSLDAAVARNAVARIAAPLPPKEYRALKISASESGLVASVGVSGDMHATARLFADVPPDFEPFGVNYRYMLDMLPKAGKATFHVQEPKSPIIVDLEGEDDATRILMPLRV
jgi:DNA polymerase-3 subunit beta